MSVSDAVTRLKDDLGGSIVEHSSSRGQACVLVPPESWRCAVASVADSMGQGALLDICARDCGEAPLRFEVVLHAREQNGPGVLRLKIRCGGTDASMDSVSDIWPAADWFEREIFDMFGIRFEGRATLSRILTRDGFEGHPLRKDFR